MDVPLGAIKYEALHKGERLEGVSEQYRHE